MKQKILEILKKQKKLKINRKLVTCLAVLLVIVVAVAWFFIHFSIHEITVLGNSRYSDEEIIDKVCTGTFSGNTLIVSRSKGSFNPDDLAFVDQIDVSMQNSHSLLITVQERQLAGYVQYLDCNIYFDDDGVVVDSKVKDETASDEEESQDTSSSDETSSDETAEEETASGETEENGNDSEGTLLTAEAVDESDETASASSEGSSDSVTEETSGSETAETSETEETAVLTDDQQTYVDALAEAPLIEGLNFDSAVMGQVLSVKDPSVFNTIQSISRMISKYNDRPEVVSFDEDMNITLEYTDVTVNLGQDELLEEKLTRMAAIMKKLGRRKGTLHLEDYDGSTVNIIFTVADEEDTTEDTETTQDTSDENSVSAATVSHDAALVTGNENIIHLKKNTQDTSAASEISESLASETGTSGGSRSALTDLPSQEAGTDQTTDEQNTAGTQTTTGETDTADQGQTNTTDTAGETNQTNTADTAGGTNQTDTTGAAAADGAGQTTTTDGQNQTQSSSGSVQIDKPVLQNLQ